MCSVLFRDEFSGDSSMFRDEHTMCKLYSFTLFRYSPAFTQLYVLRVKAGDARGMLEDSQGKPIPEFLILAFAA